MFGYEKSILHGQVGLRKHKYCPLMKLNVHTGAAYVIARRGQGFKETKIN